MKKNFTGCLVPLRSIVPATVIIVAVLGGLVHFRQGASAHAGLMWTQTGVKRNENAAAVTFCRGLYTGGFTDWRLPEVGEIEGVWNDESLRKNFTLFSYSPAFWTNPTKAGGSVNLMMFKPPNTDSNTIEILAVCVREAN